MPALVVVLAVIIFPWVFTIWMSLNEWKVGSPTAFVGLANYARLPSDPRFVEAIGQLARAALPKEGRELLDLAAAKEGTAAIRTEGRKTH